MKNKLINLKNFLIAKYSSLPRSYQNTLPIIAVFILTVGITLITLLALTGANTLKVTKAPNDAPFIYAAYDPGHGFAAFIAEKETNEPKVKANFAGGATAEFVLKDLAEKLDKPRRLGNKITFKSIKPSIDLTYETLTNGIKENIILNEKPTDNQFNFDLATTGATPNKVTETTFGTTFFNSEGKYLFHLTKPYAIDAKGARTDAAYYLVQPGTIEGTFEVSLFVNKDWLMDDARSLPITIDPTIVYDTTSLFAAGQFNRAFDLGGGSSPSLQTYYQELSSDQYTVALWHLNESSGAITDSSGNAATGTAANTTYNTSTPFLGAGSQTFNGVSSNIGLAGGGNANVVGDITIEMWIKPDFSAQGNPIHKESQYSIQIDTAGNFYWADSSNWSYAAYGATNIGLANGVWQHLAVTKTNGVVRVYVNGVERSAKSFGGAITGNTNIMRLGCYAAAAACSQAYFKGELDEVRISTIARPAEEIRLDAQRRPYSIYTSNVLDFSSNTSGWNPFTWVEKRVATGDGETVNDATNLVAQWDFNEASGTVASNSISGASNPPATGGTETDAGGYHIHTFTSNGTFNVTGSLSQVEVLVVGGGGGGNQGYNGGGGGGGAGGYQYNAALPVTTTTYPVTVGGGGALGVQGSNSSFSTITALGGGKANLNSTGSNGGSGAGGGTLQLTGAGGGTGSQGNNGGAAATNGGDGWSGGGGGGAGSAGGNASTYVGGNGGAGLANSISGASVTYAGGGAGASTSTGGTGGAGGGGNPGVAGTANRGGGGGANAAGGSGIVIIRYPYTPSGGCGTPCNATLTNFASTGSRDALGGSGWTANNKRWGAGALMVDGVNDYLTVNNSALNLSNNFSIETWYKAIPKAADQMLISWGELATGKRRAIWIQNTTGYIGFSGYAANIISTKSVTDGDWHHIVVTLDQANLVKIYVDGVLVTSGTPTLNSFIYGGTGIGGNVNGTELASGIIDSMRIYSRVLTLDEIISNYNAATIEVQSRVGATNNPNDGSWEPWKPVTAESLLYSMDSYTPTGCTGGTPVDGGKAIMFTSSGTLTCTSNGMVEVLVVAGGGGGGFDMGGGGGGGGVIYNPAYPVVANTPITVTVGNGGAGAPAAGTSGQPAAHQYTIPASNGQNSVFGTLTAIGGGAGGSSYYAYTPGPAGYAGGSGGGASGYSDGTTRAGGAGTVGQGNRGGNGGGAYYSGGGGGAGAQGTDSTAQANGGIGILNDILGTAYYWAGGGGGAGYTICGGNGGEGGGGGGGTCTTTGGSGLNPGAGGGGGATGSQTNAPGGNGGANTGGGGGAGSHYNGNNKGGNGGSGIVVVRLSRLSTDTTTKTEGTASQSLTTGQAQLDGNTVGLWHLDETSGTGAYIKNSSPLNKEVFNYTGADQTYTVPPGVTSLNVKMWGGGGGAGNIGGWTYGFDGGGGGYTTGTLAVTPGQVLTVISGAGGTNGTVANTSPNYGGGARSCNTGSDCRYGGQGGGRSAIRLGATELMTAGGGGGGGSSRAANGQQGGGGGGATGGTGASYTAASGGGGGTQVAGGAAGLGGSNGVAGTQFAGGNPGSNAYGGSGGGGWFGGGGGAYMEPNDMGGGGGGSGYIGGSGVSAATTTAASGRIQANATDLDNAGAGLGGKSINAMNNGMPGKVVITPNATIGHGTPTGTNVFNGISGKARNIAGGSIIVPDNTLLNPSKITIELWVKSTTTGDFAILHKYAPATPWQGYGINIFGASQAGKHGCWVGGNAWTIGPTAVNDGVWHHIACIYDGTNVSTYVDGVPGTPVAQAAVLTYPVQLNIGIGVASTAIDEVRISNIARTRKEMVDAYRMGRDSYYNIYNNSTDISSATTLPFAVAADRPGTYLEAAIGESAFSNRQTDVNTVGYWRMDEAYGIGQIDTSGYNNNGAGQGTMALVPGRFGKARLFNGTTDYILVPDSNSLDLTTQGTIELWFKRNATQNYQMYLTKGDGANPGGYQLMDVSTTNRIAFRWAQDSDTIQSVSAVPNGVWTHLVATYNGSTIAIYINGVLDKSAAYSGVATANALPLRIGSRADGYYYSGIIDEVKVSKVGYTAEQVRQAYEISKHSHPITIDFGAKLDAGNLISGSGDTAFTIDATYYGLSSKGSKLFLGDKVIVRENVGGTYYTAQGVVNAVSESTGAVVVTSWDAGSTFPAGGFTVNADVFKWQQEFFDLTGMPSTNRDAINQLTLRVTNSSEGRNVWIDDFRKTGPYLTNPTGSTIDSSTGNQYFQFRFIGKSYDYNVSSAVSAATIDYQTLAPNVPTIGTPTAGTTSITWGFTDNATNETETRLYDVSSVLKFTCIGENLSECTETGLIPNTQYTRKITATNANGNSPYSATATKYTLAETPAVPVVSNRASSTIQINPDPASNSAATLFAIYKEEGFTCDGTGGAYLAANGSDNGSTAVWQTEAAWSTVTATGLNSEKAYAFCVKAKNADNIETAWSPSASYNAGFVPLSGQYIYNGNTINTQDFANRYPDGYNVGRYVIAVDDGQATNSAVFKMQSGILVVNSTDTLAVGKLSLEGGSIALSEAGGQIKIGTNVYIKDEDGDGWSSDGKLYIDTPPAGGRRKAIAVTLAANDCNDANATQTGGSLVTYYQDADGDGFGRSSVSVQDCSLPAGYVLNNTDCNDSSNLVSISHAQCYADYDGDTFTNGLAANSTCLNTSSCATATQASGSTHVSAVTAYAAGRLQNTPSAITDCKDTGAYANMVMYSGLTCYYDADNDDYGVATARTCLNTQACATATWGTTGAADDAGNINFASNTSDCYDGNANARPGSAYCGTVHRGDGSFDYDCSATSVKCGTDYNYGTTAYWVPGEQGLGSCKNNNARCGSLNYNTYGGAAIGCGQTGAVCTGITTVGTSCGSCGSTNGGYSACYQIASGVQGCI